MVKERPTPDEWNQFRNDCDRVLKVFLLTVFSPPPFQGDHTGFSGKTRRLGGGGGVLERRQAVTAAD